MPSSLVRASAERCRVLVIGATGQLGPEVVAALGRMPGPIEVIEGARSHPDATYQIDLAKPGTVQRLVQSVRPMHIILTAAATNVAWCEEYPAESRLINVLGTQAAARAANEIGASFTFMSSDYVFDGLCGPYREDEPTNPINVYGAHKLEAEAAVLAAGANNLVVRTCQVFGADPRRMNFVVRVADRLRAGETVEAAADLFGTPTYAPDLGRSVAELTLSDASGIWNVAGETFLSRHELARMVADAFGCNSDAVLEVSANGMADQVSRPRRAGLTNARLQDAGVEVLTPLAAALAELAALDGHR